MPPVFCSAPDLTLEELEAELGLIGSAKQILAAIAVQARLPDGEGEEDAIAGGQEGEEAAVALALALRGRLRSPPAVGAEYLASSRELETPVIDLTPSASRADPSY